VLSLSNIPTVEERDAALAAVPWCAELRERAGYVLGVMREQSIDLIDVALGGGHARAALVALQEGVDAYLQASVELVESVLCEQVLARHFPADPLGRGEPLAANESRERVRFRFARSALEDATVKAVSASDHLANAHLRLAWEANSLSADEANLCGFDPSKPEPTTWASVPQLRDGLRQLETQPLAVFPAFVVNRAFVNFADNPAIGAVREYRNEIVHRARPSYRESPALGRTSLWEAGEFSITVPPKPEDRQQLPTLADRRRLVGSAISAAMPYTDLLWNTAVRWLGTVGVVVHHDTDNGEVHVTTEHFGRPIHPRTGRDPGPFLAS
jgi:hypothetical protein